VRAVLWILLTLVAWPAGAFGDAREAAEKVRQGIAHFRAGEYQKAVRAFQEADVALPENPRIAFDQACALAARGDAEKAADLLIKAALARNRPLAARSHYNLGGLAAQKAQAVFGEKPREAPPEVRDEGMALLAEAVGHYRDCLALDENHADARHNLEVIRLWIKHMQAVWQQRDRQKERDELGLLEFLLLIESRQRELRLAAQAIAGEADSPRRRQALVTLEDSQRTLADEIEPLKEKIREVLKPDPGAGQPGPAGAGAQGALSLSPEEAEKAIELLSGLANDARRAMSTAADLLHGGSVAEAVDSQTEAVEGLNQLYVAVVPFASLLQRAIAAQEGLVDRVAAVVEDPKLDQPPDLHESAWDQRIVGGWAEALGPKAEHQLKGLEGLDPSAMAAAAPSGQADPEAMKEQIEGLKRSMQKAVELGPQVKTLADEAAAHLGEKKPTEALPKQEEALKLLEEIAEPLPKQNQEQQGDQNQDGQQQDDESQQQQQSGNDQPERQDRRPQDLSRRQAEAVLRKVRDRQRDRRRLDQELQEYLYRPDAVEEDW
jgi:hypothetical protein